MTETGYAMSGQVEIQPVAATMRLTGTLRRRRSDFYLEEQLCRNAEHERDWTVPRIYRLSEFTERQAGAGALVDDLVMVTGSPHYSAVLRRTVVVLESISPAILESVPDPGSRDVGDHGTAPGLTS